MHNLEKCLYNKRCNPPSVKEIIRILKHCTVDAVTGCWQCDYRRDAHQQGHPEISRRMRYRVPDQVVLEEWTQRASQLMCRFYNGSYSHELQITHECQNIEYRCVNPRHLVAATHRKNVADTKLIYITFPCPPIDEMVHNNAPLTRFEYERRLHRCQNAIVRSRSS